jgi:hypothetical protein
MESNALLTALSRLADQCATFGPLFFAFQKNETGKVACLRKPHGYRFSK